LNLLKIALLVPGFSSDEQDWCIPCLLDHVRTLARWAEVHVFTLRWPERGGTYPIFGATVHALDGRKRMGLRRVVNLWARAMRAIAAEHRRAPFDLLHAISADEPGWVSAWAARRLNAPFILSPMGGEFVAMPDIGYGFQLLPGRAVLTRWAVQRAACVTAGSHYQRRLVEAIARPRQLLRAPFGVDATLFSASPPTPSPDRRTSRSGEGVAKPGVRILSVASLTPVKNHALLLRAIARTPGVCLRLAGGGPLENHLRALAVQLGIADRVEFLGHVNHGALPAVYQQADVFVQTSRHEAQGLAVLEAAACGLPIVGTPVGVLPEIGVTARDEAELTQRLVELRDDPPRRTALGESARREVLAKFALSVTAERWRELYHTI
jgi:glycosyltransferase involved in cell wall biosynthesis